MSISSRSMLREPFNRRTFLAGATTAAASIPLLDNRGRAADAQADEPLGFFVIGDTHFLADEQNPNRMQTKSAEICGRLVDMLNRLEGTDISGEAGGGKVRKIAGVIHAGDVIDTGDKNGATPSKMQATELAAFRDEYGLTGQDGRLKVPLYEMAGNHDAPQGTGPFIELIRERNKNRPHVVHVSDNGVQYSWNWGNVHFINLGLIVGGDPEVTRKRRYAALDSLQFLKRDLKEHVSTPSTPIVITHHVDIARYTGKCDPSQPADSKEWDTCDVSAFHNAIKDFNVVGIFYGHTHARNIFQWDGASPKATNGIRVFNTDNASHFGGDAQAFFYVEVTDNRLTVREFQTKDRWQTGEWTPQVWRTT